MDHIFEERDGQLVYRGDFDGLYRDVTDPWGQSGIRPDNAEYYRFSRSRVANLLGSCLREDGRRIEIGCGHGWTLPQFEAAAGGEWSGIDICPAAIGQAQKLHPAFNFYVGNIMQTPPAPPSMFGRYDCVVFSQLLWYVLPRLAQTIDNAARFLEIGGLLFVTQAFLREQRYGREIVDGFEGLLRHVLASYPHLSLIEARYDDSGKYPFNDGLVVLRKTRHAQ